MANKLTTQKTTKLEKYNKQILDEINKCWEEKHPESDLPKPIFIKDLLKDDKNIFIKNIKWVEVKNGIYPYYFCNINGNEKILIDIPYNQLDIKAYRNGDMFIYNNLLNIRN